MTEYDDGSLGQAIGMANDLGAEVVRVAARSGFCPICTEPPVAEKALREIMLTTFDPDAKRIALGALKEASAPVLSPGEDTP